MCAAHLIHASLGPSDSKSQTGQYLDRFGRLMDHPPPQNYRFQWGIWPRHLIHDFLGPAYPAIRPNNDNKRCLSHIVFLLQLTAGI